MDITYDNMGRLITTDFTDTGTPDIARTYDANGNVLAVNRGTGNDAVDWTYTYDDRNALLTEELAIDGDDYKTTYRYDSYGHLEYRKTPSGRWMDVYKDGLGRDLGVHGWGSHEYAENITYHANGTVASMLYRNGYLFTQTLNDRLQPARRMSYDGATGARNARNRSGRAITVKR